jgi:uncharacterized protein (TIGR02996 family)
VDLLSDILAAPHDDVPRLVYADALLDRGDLRGELIHIQCKLARLGARAPERAALAAREKLLLDEHGASWAKPFVELGARAHTFVRGFVEHLLFTNDRLEAKVRAAHQLTPLTKLAVMEVFGDFMPLMRVLASPSGRRLTGVDLRYQQIGDAALAPLLGTLRFAPIAWLGLEANQLGDSSARLIAHAPFFDGLRQLILDENGITDVGAIELGRSTVLTQLRDLQITATDMLGPPRTNRITDLGAAALARLPLERLMLTWNPIGDRGAAALAASPALANLRELGLCRCEIGPAGARALASSPSLARLERLDLTGNLIEDDGATALLNSPYLPRSLELSLTGFGRFPVGVSPKRLNALRQRFARVVTFFMADHQR